MSRKHTATALAVLVVWSVPSAAFAAGGAESIILWGAGGLTLIAAAGLLVLALGLSRVSRGSVMADNISYVVAACVCLSASVLARWTGRFASDALVSGQIELAEQFLLVATIVFMCVYFYRVRAALKKLVDDASTERAKSTDAASAASPDAEAVAAGAGDA